MTSDEVYKLINGPGPGPKKPKPTTADSLELYNNAMKVFGYFNTNKSYRKTRSEPNDKNFINTFVNLDLAYSDRPTTAHTPEGKSVRINDYRKLHPTNKNMFYQREMAHNYINTNAPMQLFDRRIIPTRMVEFYNETPGDKMYGDAVDLYMYEPLAIKPYHMLTEKEKVIRAKYFPNSAGFGTNAPQVKPTVTNQMPATQIKRTIISKPAQQIVRKPISLAAAQITSEVDPVPAPERQAIPATTVFRNGQRVPITQEEYDTMTKNRKVTQIGNNPLDSTRYEVLPTEVYRRLQRK